MPVLPAVEGVHWCTALNGSRRNSWFCMKCDPKSIGDGYYDIGSMNRHLIARHEKRAFSSRSRREEGGSTDGCQTRGKSRKGVTHARSRMPAKKTSERTATPTAPKRGRRKRPETDTVEVEPPNKRATVEEANIKGDRHRPSEDTPIRDGTLYDWLPSTMQAPTPEQGDHYITIPVSGLRNISFTSETSARNASQKFEANWYQMKSVNEGEECLAKDPKIKRNRRPDGWNVTLLFEGHANGGCSANVTRAPVATFPVLGFKAKAMVITHGKKSRGEIILGDDVEDIVDDIEGKGSESQQWALRPMDELKKGDPHVPLVDYSSSSDGED